MIFNSPLLAQELPSTTMGTTQPIRTVKAVQKNKEFFTKSLKDCGIKNSTASKLRAGGIETLEDLRKKGVHELKNLEAEEVKTLRKVSLLFLLSEDVGLNKELAKKEINSVRDLQKLTLRDIKSASGEKFSDMQAEAYQKRVRALSNLINANSRNLLAKFKNPSALCTPPPLGEEVRKSLISYGTETGACEFKCDESTDSFSPAVYLLYLLDFMESSFGPKLDSLPKINCRFKQKFEDLPVSQDVSQSASYVQYTNEILEDLIAELLSGRAEDWPNVATTDEDERNRLMRIKVSIYDKFKDATYQNEPGFDGNVLMNLFDSYIQEFGTSRKEIRFVKKGSTDFQKQFCKKLGIRFPDDLDAMNLSDEAVTYDDTYKIKSDSLKTFYSTRMKKTVRQEWVSDIEDDILIEFGKYFREFKNNEMERVLIELVNSIETGLSSEEHDKRLLEMKGKARSCVEKGTAEDCLTDLCLESGGEEGCPIGRAYINNPINPIRGLYFKYAETLGYRGNDNKGFASNKFGELQRDIKQKKHVELIEEEGSDLFEIELSYRSDLDNNIISDNLKQVFDNNGVTLSGSSRVLLLNEGVDWGIIDDGNTQLFAIKRQEDRLIVRGDADGLETKAETFMKDRTVNDPEEELDNQIHVLAESVFDKDDLVPDNHNAFQFEVDKRAAEEWKIAVSRAEVGFLKKVRSNLIIIALHKSRSGVGGGPGTRPPGDQPPLNGGPGARPPVETPGVSGGLYARPPESQGAFSVSNADIEELANDLHLDLAVDETNKTTPLAFAISRIHSFIQAIQLGTEKEQYDIAAFNERKDTWSWMQSYGLWHAAMMVTLYPENFLMPDLRHTRTTQFINLSDAIEEDLQADIQSIVSQEYIEPVKKLTGMNVVGSRKVKDRLFVFATKYGDVFYSIIYPNGKWSSWQQIEGFPEFRWKQESINRNRDEDLYIFYGPDIGAEEKIYFFTFRNDEANNDPTEFDNWVLNSTSLTINKDKLISDGSWSEMTDITINTFFQHRIWPGEIAFTVGVENHPPSGEPSRYLYVWRIWPDARKMKVMILYYDIISNSFRKGSFEDENNDNYYANAQKIKADSEGQNLLWVQREQVNNLTGNFLYAIFNPTPSTINNRIKVSDQPIGSVTKRKAPLIGITSSNDNKPSYVIYISAGSSSSKMSRYCNNSWQTIKEYAQLGTDIELFQDQVYLFLKEDIDCQSVVWLASLNNLSCEQTYARNAILSPLRLTYAPDVMDFGSILDVTERFSYSNFGDYARIYLEEYYFHIPIYIATKLNEAGRYEEAMRWLSKVYDPIKDTEDKRRVYPDFHSENITTFSSREIGAWLENPFNPYELADLHKESYLISIKLLHVKNLLDWADHLFVQDTNESVNRARELYELAGGILGMHDWPIDDCDLETYNFTTSMESNSRGTDNARIYEAVRQLTKATQKGVFPDTAQVLRSSISNPCKKAKIERTKDALATKATIKDLLRRENLATVPGILEDIAIWLIPDESFEEVERVDIGEEIPEIKPFCIPMNPMVKLLRWRIDSNLAKIRTNRSFAGMQRDLQPYATPIDPTKLVRQAASGGIEFEQFIPTTPPPIYRYSFLVDRARYLVSAAQQFEGSMLSSLKEKDAEEYSYMKAKQDIGLERANLTLQSLKIREANDSKKLADSQLRRVEIQQKYYNDLIDEGVLEKEWAAIIAQGLIGAYYISTASASMQFATAATIAQETASSIMLTMAAWDRRAAEWKYQLSLSDQDYIIAGIGADIAQDHIDIANQELDIANKRLEVANDTVEFLGNKFTNKDLYSWMSKNLRKLYREQLNMAISTAKAAQKALEFERQTSLDFIGYEYWDDEKQGLLGAEQLLKDINRMDQHRISTATRKKEIEKIVSLASIAPVEFQKFKKTGVLDFATLQKWFDRDFPGHYMRLIRDVSLTVYALIPANEGIHGTLSNPGISRAMVGEPFEEPSIIYRLPESIAISSPNKGTGLFELKPDTDPMLLPFEGSGVETAWRLEMPKGANRFDYNAIFDILLTIRYTAFEDRSYRDKILTAMGQDEYGNASTEAVRYFSIRNEFADQWYYFHNPPRGESIEYANSTTNDIKNEPLPPYTMVIELNEKGFVPNEELRKIKKVSLAAKKSKKVEGEKIPLKLQFIPFAGSATNQVLMDIASDASSTEEMNGKKPYGKWILELDISDTSNGWIYPDAHKPPDISWFDDIFLVIEYKARVHYNR